MAEGLDVDLFVGGLNAVFGILGLIELFKSMSVPFPFDAFFCASATACLAANISW